MRDVFAALDDVDFELVIVSRMSSQQQQAKQSAPTATPSRKRNLKAFSETKAKQHVAPVVPVVVAPVVVVVADVADVEPVVDVVPSSASVPRGRNVSGRDWKPVQRERKTALFKGNRALRSFEERQQLRVMRDAVRAKSNELKAEAEAARAEEKATREAKRKRKEANQAKNTVYQPITNVHKIRKMTAKQARQIRKVL